MGQGIDIGERDEHLPYLLVVAFVVPLACMLLAALVSPAFAWREYAFSTLGVTWTDTGTTVTVLLFNGSLITGGLVGVASCSLLYRRARRRADRVVLGLLAVTMVAIGLVGLFPVGTRLHLPLAGIFFLLISITLWVAGAVRYRAGERRWGALSIAGGTVHILVWVVWFAATQDPMDGLAIPEMLGALIFGGWLSGFVLRLLRS